MMRTLSLLLIGAVLIGFCHSAESQQPAKVPTVGWLIGREASAGTYRFNELTQRVLRELGYIENQNIRFEYRYAENKFERLPALADELVRLKVDVIYAASANAALAAKNASRTIPIVFVSTTDPIVNGLVQSLARPGGNVTGFTTIAPMLVGKRLELLKETIPRLSRIAFLWNPLNPTSKQEWKEGELEAQRLGLKLHSMEVSSSENLEHAFEGAMNAGSSGITVAFDGAINAKQKRIAQLAISNRLPMVCPREDFVQSGGLLSYGPDQAEPYRRVASMIDKILKGSKPVEIPVEQPKKFEFVINLKTAKQIGLTIPPNVLARADRVIK
jgi:putative ABC transport system substrate-binding protein